MRVLLDEHCEDNASLVNAIAARILRSYKTLLLAASTTTVAKAARGKKNSNNHAGGGANAVDMRALATSGKDGTSANAAPARRSIGLPKEGMSHS